MELRLISSHALPTNVLASEGAIDAHQPKAASEAASKVVVAAEDRVVDTWHKFERWERDLS